MATIDRGIMPVLCAPSDDYTFDNLDLTQSNFTEDGIKTNAPVATDVDTDHTLTATAPCGVDEAYEILMRVADDGGGTFIGRNASTWIYRDTEEADPENNWFGWSDVQYLHDIENVNLAEATSANLYQYPTCAADCFGNLYVTSSLNKTVIVSKKDKSTGWAGPVIAVKSTENKVELDADRNDGSLVYVERKGRKDLYLFWPSWDDATSPSKVSIGVSITTDLNATWKLLTSAILPFSDSSSLTWNRGSGIILKRVRAAYNPFSDTFTVTFSYNDGVDDKVYCTVIDQRLNVGSWGQSFDDYVTQDIVVDPVTGVERLVAYNTSSSALVYRERELGAIAWSDELATFSFANYDQDVGLAAWMHQNGNAVIYTADTTAEAAQPFFITQSGSLAKFTAFGYPNAYIAGANSRLQHIGGCKLTDGAVLVGNPVSNGGARNDELLALFYSGWDNTPTLTAEESNVNPWDLPQDQDGAITWTQNSAAGGSGGVVWTPGYVCNKTESTGAGELNYSGTSTGDQAVVVKFKVEVNDAYNSIQPTGTSTKDGYVYYEMVGYDGVDRSGWRINLSDTEWNLLDIEAGSYKFVDIPKALKGNQVWFKVAYSTGNHKITVWTSDDGKVWTEHGTPTLTTTADATAASLDHEWGVNGGVAFFHGGYWQSITIHSDSTVDTVEDVIDYNDYTNAFTNDIFLDGMPITATPNYITKGVLVSGSGTQAVAKEAWSLDDFADFALSNALYGGPDSPRVKWKQTGTAAAELFWDFTDEPRNAPRGFLYINGAGISNVLLEATRFVSPTTLTLINKTPSDTLGGNWTREGNVIFPGSGNTSIVYFDRDQLKGSYIQIGAEYFKVKSSTPGYWSNDQGQARMRITVEGDTTSAASSGSNLVAWPDTMLFLFKVSDVTEALKDVKLTLSSGGGSGVIEVCKVRLGFYYPIVADVQAGGTRGSSKNSVRTFSPGGLSVGTRLGPSARTRSFVVQSSDSPKKYEAQTSVQTNAGSWDVSIDEIDMHSTPDVLESLFAEYGDHTPVVWCDNWEENPSNTAVKFYSREIVYGFLDMSTVTVTNTTDAQYRGGVESVSQYVVTELV